MKTRVAVVGIAVLVVLVACAPPTPAPAPPAAGPTPVPAPPAAGPTPENRFGAPRVTEPRDVTSRAADPCGTLLTPADLDRLDYASPGTPDVTASGAPACFYLDDDSRRTAQVTVEVSRDLLLDTYFMRIFPILIPTEIDGLPATHEQFTPDSLSCKTVVGVADEQGINVDTNVVFQPVGLPLIDPCEDGARVAEAVVSTLPPA